MVNKKVLEYLIDTLVHNGIDTYFLVTGGAIVPTIDYIGTKPEAKYFCFQHEQSAAMAAEAYYRTTGKLGVVLSTSGPGAQNLLNGICGCWYESIPCLFITGQVSTYESLDFIDTKPRQLGFQEMPVVDSFKPFTKFIKKINNANDFKQDLQQALTRCFEGRPGPSLLDIPTNIQNSIINEEVFTINSKPLITNINHQLKKLNKQLEISKRPLLLIGHGVRLSNAVEEINELVNKLNIPFVVSWGGFDIISHDHPLFVGDIGVYGNRGGNFAIQNCDLLISIGSRLDTRQTGGDLTTFSRESFKVMVDIDKNEIYKGRGLKIDLPITCDAKQFITEWLENSTAPIISQEWFESYNRYKNLKLDNRPLKPNVLTSYEFLEYLDS